MTDVEIGRMTTTIEFEPEVNAAAAPPTGAAPGGGAADAQRLKALLRPVILDILGEEMDMSTRTRG